MNTRPYTTPPKPELRVLLLENIHESAVQLFNAEGFQVERVKGALPEAELRQRQMLGLGVANRVMQ